MSEVLFYHLTEKRLEEVLPGLLEKCIERDWRVVVQSGSPDQVETLDSQLWNWRDDSFLPHGFEKDGSEQDQPIWICNNEENPNGASVRFMVDSAVAPDLDNYQRGIYIFDGHDAQALENARKSWKREKDAGHDVTYWQQNTNGGWEKKA